MEGPRGLVELSSTTLCSLGLPPHVGRGDAAVVRSTRSESFFDLITKLRLQEFCLEFIVVTRESGARTLPFR